MKVTINQISEGLARYIDQELVPKVPGIRKWMLGLAGGYAGQMLQGKAAENKVFLESLGVMDADGMIDIDALHTRLKAAADSSGTVTEHIPMIGDVTFDSSDIDRLKSYIVS